jgi:preprotein translocase subunit SecG
MFNQLLSNISLGTANFLAYAIMGLVVLFLVFGPAVTYYFWKKNQKMKESDSTETPPQASGP